MMHFFSSEPWVKWPLERTSYGSDLTQILSGDSKMKVKTLCLISNKLKLGPNNQ